MSQENVDRALELLDAFNRRDLDALRGACRRWDRGGIPTRLPWRAATTVTRGCVPGGGDFLRAFPDYSLEV